MSSSKYKDKSSAAPADDPFQCVRALSDSMAHGLFETQNIGLQAWLAWQRSMNDLSQELWDEWCCRFAGGAPIGD